MPELTALSFAAYKSSRESRTTRMTRGADPCPAPHKGIR